MKRGYADSPHGQLHYSTDGAGEPLVCLHPSPRSSRAFWRLTPIWARSRQVIAFDTLGFGNSDPIPPGATMEMLADSVAGALDHMGIAKIDLFGMHTGNKIGAAFAVKYPERVGKLILCGMSHSLIVDPAARNDAIMDIVQGYFQGTAASDPEQARLERWARFFDTIAQIWWDRETLAQPRLSQESLDRLEARLLDEVVSRHATATVYQANFDFDFAGAVASLKPPTLFIELCTAKEDKQLGRHGADLLKALPGSRLVTLENAAYEALEFRADDIADAVERFLAAA